MRKTLIAAGMILALIFSSVSVQAEAAVSPRAAAKSVTLERVGGPLYAKYKKKFPKSLNWSNNGCSVPKALFKVPGLGAVLKRYSKFWQKSCDRHDFGYRNRKLHGYSRKTVDNKFLSNMRYQCAKGNAPGWPEPVAKAACRGAANVFYQAVRRFGRW